MNNRSFRRRSRVDFRFFLNMVLALVLTVAGSASSAAALSITSANWNASKGKLFIKGAGEIGSERVIVTNAAATSPVLAHSRVRRNESWRVGLRNVSPVPCRVRASQGGVTVERNVRNAPADCGPQPLDIGLDAPQTDFKLLMNYELGMHCTGFEFAYCCALPVYNSILTQVVKSESGSGRHPILLEGDPNVGLDFLGRETVLRDRALDGSDNFLKYVARYSHEAQPRNDGRGKIQTSTRISAAEGNSLLMWNTELDAAATDGNNVLVEGSYNGAYGVVQGDGDTTDPEDNYANGWMNHLYIYSDLEGTSGPNTDDVNKIRLGLPNTNSNTPLSLVVPTDCGPAFHPLGAVTQDGDPDNPEVANDCGGYSNGNVLTFSEDTGTVVFTQSKVLEDLPVMLTSPRIWEALGLPLTPFEDSMRFWSDPGLVDEDSIRPFVAMKAQLFHHDGADNDVAVLDGGGDPVIGFGTAPIDIPNCERCHSAPPEDEFSNPNINSPNDDLAEYALVQAEIDFWNAFYGIMTAAGDSDWYSRLKGASISILSIHDTQHGTGFTDFYPGCTIAGGDCGPVPTNTRLGKESVVCQKCHADNVIAVVKSACQVPLNVDGSCSDLIPPLSEAIHHNHRSTTEQDAGGDPGPIAFSDALGRDGGCQGCHPAHRSDGIMAGYPITLDGDNFYADSDNRLANGGCFVGRDVHSNINKDADGAGTPEHLTAVGQWLSTTVFDNQAGQAGSDQDTRGLWCTNCHTQLSQEIWKAENCPDLIHGDCITDVRGQPTLAAVAGAVGVSEDQAKAWLDPNNINLHGTGLGDFTHAIWDPSVADAAVAIIETNGGVPQGSTDADGHFSVRVLENFCTTPDCLTAAQAVLDGEGNGSDATLAPFSAATDGREHWLAPGEPHCADCHMPPFTEQSGNINQFPPFNYPRKASLMRYSRGHRDITCQGCHESTHGLYPVGAAVDTTTYAQAASLNPDGSHGPIKCGACHEVDGDGIPTLVCPNDDMYLFGDVCTTSSNGLSFNGTDLKGNYDTAVAWAHSFTDEADKFSSTPGSGSAICLNCHEARDHLVADDDPFWLSHAEFNFVTRRLMDQVETELLGDVSGAVDPLNTVCLACHSNHAAGVVCSDTRWLEHLTLGRVADEVYEAVSNSIIGSTCGW